MCFRASFYTIHSSPIQSMSESSGVFVTNPDSGKPTQGPLLRKLPLGFHLSSEVGSGPSPDPREGIA